MIECGRSFVVLLHVGARWALVGEDHLFALITGAKEIVAFIIRRVNASWSVFRRGTGLVCKQ